MGVEKQATAWLDLYLDHDKDRFERMAQGNRPVELLSEATGERSPRFREILFPLGHAHEMSGVLTHDGGLWGTVELARGAGSSNFRPREVALLRRVAPHLGAGLKACALHWRAPVERDGADVPGVLTFDHQGRVTTRTGAAERLARELGDLGPGWWEGADTLPVVVRIVETALRRALNWENGSDHDSVPRLRIRARSGRWLTLYASLAKTDSG